MAYVVGAVEPEGLRAVLRARLPEYMVPAACVVLDALPLTPNGKLDRKALPAPEREHQVSGAYVAPQSELEQQLAAVWQEVLKVERVGVHDNFFDIGGHSLLAIESIVKFKQRTGHLLDPNLFYQQTLGQLAASVDGGNGAPGDREARAETLDLIPSSSGPTGGGYTA